MKAFALLMRKLLRQPSCEEVNRFLAEYVDGELAVETQTKFASHLRMCKGCEMHLDNYRETIELAKNSRDIEIPSELVTHTVQFLRMRMRKN